MTPIKMMRIARSFVLAASLVAAPAAFACEGDGDGAPTAKQQTPAPASATTVSYTVEGIHCSGCTSKIEAAVLKIPGVYTVSVDLEKKTAKVAYDAKKVKLDQIKHAITKAGFKPAVVA